MKLQIAAFTLAVALLPATVLAQEAGEVATDTTQSPTPKQAPPAGETPINPAVAERVEVMLGGIEFEPTATQWIALGADAPRALLLVVNDQELQVVQRSRAIVALVHFDHQPSAPALEALLADEKTPDILTRKAMWTLARIARAEAVETITPHLESPKLAVREEAVDSLAFIASKSAVDVLRARLQTEKSDYLKKKIRTAIASGETR